MKGIILISIITLVIFLIWFVSQTEPSDDNGNDDDIPPVDDTIPSYCEYNMHMGTIECMYKKTGKNTRSLSIPVLEHSALTLSGEFKIGGAFSSIVKVWVIDTDDRWHKIFEGQGDAQHTYPFVASMNYTPKRIKVEGNKDLFNYGDYIDMLSVHITYYDWRFG